MYCVNGAPPIIKRCSSPISSFVHCCCWFCCFWIASRNGCVALHNRNYTRIFFLLLLLAVCHCIGPSLENFPDILLKWKTHRSAQIFDENRITSERLPSFARICIDQILVSHRRGQLWKRTKFDVAAVSIWLNHFPHRCNCDETQTILFALRVISFEVLGSEVIRERTE